MSTVKDRSPLTWADCPIVSRDPERLSGAWTFGNTRMPLWPVFGNLAEGMSIEEIADTFSIEPEQIREVLSHAEKMLEQDRIHPDPGI